MMWEHDKGRMKDSHTLIGLGGVYELRMVMRLCQEKLVM